MVKLRGHHLICLHFFKGEGYSEKFIDNLAQVIQNLEKDKFFEVIKGADDVCSACPYLKGNVCIYGAEGENEIRVLDNEALKLLKLGKGDKLNWKQVKTKIPKILPKWQEFACLDCDWKEVCFTKSTL